MDEQLDIGLVSPAFGSVRGIGEASAQVDESDEHAHARARRGPTISAVTFYAACAISGFFVAVIVAFFFREVIGEPIGLLLAIAAAAWVLTSLLLYHVAKQRFCDRAIVMGGGLVSAVMCSMMFLD
jgi:Na+/melibiose symporter-like transporter